MGLFSKIFKLFKRDNGLVVLSLFDGIGGAYLALQKAGVKIKEYYASEIDKYAIHQTQINFHDIHHLGDIKEITADCLPKHIDLVIAGSPCQSFSFAGNREGMATTEDFEVTSYEEYKRLKDEGVQFKGQSYLFWEFVRILNEVKANNPKVKFLLENVEMGEKWENVISKTLGVEPLHINSAFVSGQIRKRLYWQNICAQPEFGQDSDSMMWDFHTLDKYLEKRYDMEDYVLPRESVEKILDKMNEKSIPESIPTAEWLPYDDYNHKFPKCLTKIGTVRQTFANKAPNNGCKLIAERRPGAIKDKDVNNVVMRILTPLECASLQTVPDTYKWDVSERQMYKLLGNGWTINVVAGFLKDLKR